VSATFDDLAAYETRDPVQVAVRDRAAELLLSSAKVQQLDALRLAIVDFERAPGAVREAYFTANCMAVVADDGIVVNATFLRDAEIAIRAFGLAGSVLATPFLRHEEFMFALVEHVRERPDRYLTRLRAVTARSQEELDRREELALALVYFLGHEVGHLRARGDRRAFTTTLPEGAPLETQLAAATAKFCRHVDELHSFGFDLPDFAQVFTRGSEVRAAADAVLATLPPNQAINHDAWFEDEKEADDFGTDVLVEALAGPALGGERALTSAAATMRALFAIAVASWYRDLQVLLERMSPDVGAANVGTLMVDMMRDRQSYVRASSVFGHEHRFTLLRSAVTMGRVLERATRFEQDPELQTMSYEGPDRGRHALADAVQRWHLIRSLMDTAVKFATMGASTAWMLQKDEARGTPQLFMMQFFSLASELARLQGRGG
jgi:hypothetical protein